MKIGIFSDRYLPQTDGISFSIESFRRQLEAKGHEVYVFAPKPSWRYKERSERIIRFSAIKGLFFEDWLTSIFFPPQAIAEIDKIGLDVVHFQTPGQIGLLGAYYATRRGLPLVTTYHTDLYEYVKHYPQVLPGIIALSLLTPVILGGGRGDFRKALSGVSPEASLDKWNQKIVTHNLTLLHNHCDLVITPSPKIERQLVSWGTTSRVVVLPTGVDRIPSTKREVSALRKRLGLHPQNQMVLLVCRIGTEKNIELLINAFAIAALELPRAKLVIVGPGDDLEHYQEMAAKTTAAARIQFTDFVDHRKLGAYYALADVFAFPSTADTQGMTVNEAASAGVPVVMVDREISEVVVDGENGYYAASEPEDFAAKLVAVLRDPILHRKFSARSVELAVKVSEDSQANKLIELYEHTIANKKPPQLDEEA